MIRRIPLCPFNIASENAAFPTPLGLTAPMPCDHDPSLHRHPEDCEIVPKNYIEVKPQNLRI